MRWEDQVSRKPFYVGSPTAMDSSYRKATLAAAVRAAIQKMEQDDALDSVPVVKVMRVVRRASSPLIVEIVSD